MTRVPNTQAGIRYFFWFGFRHLQIGSDTTENDITYSAVSSLIMTASLVIGWAKYHNNKPWVRHNPRVL
jgi:hypothetical protein